MRTSEQNCNAHYFRSIQPPFSPSLHPLLPLQASGVKVADECVDSYELMKQKRKYKYCIYRLSDNLKEIVIDKVFDNPGCEDRPTTQGDYGPFWE